MQNKEVAATVAGEEVLVVIEDAGELTPKELAQERKAALEENKRKAWLGHTPAEWAGRIPVSVFALGNHLADA